MNNTAIKVEHVSKTFKLPHQKHTSIKSLFLNMLRRSNRTYEKQKVLSDISFEIKQGEFFGIVGRNGSGKSTLLKLLAGIYSPDKGVIQINGKLTPFIELGVGFNPELTGRENVYLNGALLGFNRKEMEAMYSDIVNFAELEKFMDQKLKNYSSGMQVRLAFSIAIRARSEILLVDEVLAVGDAAFQAKCFDVFAKLKETGRTVILVTHDMNSVLRFCDKAMLINNGKVLSVDNPSKISDKYLELNYDNRENINDKESYKYIKSANLQIVDSDKNVDTISQKDSIKIIISYENKNIEKLHFGLQLFNDSGTYCFGTNTKISRRPVINKKQGRVGVELQDLNLLAGTYHFTLAVMNESATQVLEYRPKLIEFRVTKDSEYEGIIMLDHRWEAE